MGGGGATGARELDQTPTWAVAAVCAVIVVISIILESCIHMLGHFFERKKKKALNEALEKIKAELMVLGFISLLLTFGQNYIAKICIPIKYADTMLPCRGSDNVKQASHVLVIDHNNGKLAAELQRRLLWYEHRLLATDSDPAGCKHGKVPLISVHGLHQLHIFIFFLAVFHVIYSAITMMLGRLKTRRWKIWEKMTQEEHDLMNDPSRFRLTHETSFVRDHTSAWVKNPISFYFVCFFRQFFRSVRKADYLTMRHGFITVHLARGCKFDFQKYIKKSLEDDFKVVVGIPALLWAAVVFFLLFNVAGWGGLLWVSMFPLILILAVGTKLQAIISQMALDITEKHAVIQGIPLVRVSDKHFWFCWPQLVLHIIHFVLFENAFSITYFFWVWYEFGLKSCFHADFVFVLVRVALGVGVQFLCSYITLPLYALVTQMGSTMKKSIFDEQTNKALRMWHKDAKKKHDGGGQKFASPGNLGQSPPSLSEEIHPDQPIRQSTQQCNLY